VVTPGPSKPGFMGSMTVRKKVGVAVAAVLLLLLAVKLWPHPDTTHHDDNNSVPCAANDPNCKPGGSFVRPASGAGYERRNGSGEGYGRRACGPGAGFEPDTGRTDRFRGGRRGGLRER